MRKTSFLLFCLVVLGLVGRAMPVSAEWFADLYIGPAFTQSDTAAGIKYRFDNVFSGGGRAGYYFESIPWLGLGFDVSHYQPDGKASGFNFDDGIHGITGRIVRQPDGKASGLNFDARITALSFDAMLRLPLLTSKEFPAGQLQPYATVGPGVYFTDAKGGGLSASDTTAGVKAGLGAVWMLHPLVGLMAEYRFSHTRPGSQGVHVDVNTHRLQFGLTFRFGL